MYQKSKRDDGYDNQFSYDISYLYANASLQSITIQVLYLPSSISIAFLNFLFPCGSNRCLIASFFFFPPNTFLILEIFLGGGASPSTLAAPQEHYKEIVLPILFTRISTLKYLSYDI